MAMTKEERKAFLRQYWSTPQAKMKRSEYQNARYRKLKERMAADPLLEKQIKDKRHKYYMENRHKYLTGKRSGPVCSMSADTLSMICHLYFAGYRTYKIAFKVRETYNKVWHHIKKHINTMLLTYTYVQGEEQLKKLLNKMGRNEPIRFVESFAHIDNITIERIYDKSNGSDDGFKQYFILYMPHEKGTGTMSDIRHEVHEDIRNGQKKLRKV